MICKAGIRRTWCSTSPRKGSEPARRGSRVRGHLLTTAAILCQVPYLMDILLSPFRYLTLATCPLAHLQNYRLCHHLFPSPPPPNPPPLLLQKCMTV